MTTTTRKPEAGEIRAAVAIAESIASTFTDGPNRFDLEGFRPLLDYKLDAFDIRPELFGQADIEGLYAHYTKTADWLERRPTLTPADLEPIPTAFTVFCSNCSDPLTGRTGEWNGYCHVCAQGAAPESIAAELENAMSKERSRAR